MDKERVAIHINNVLKMLSNTLSKGTLQHIRDELNLTLSEIQKPNWISVENELPPYGEEVLVYSKGRQFLPHSVMRMKTNDYNFDNNGFLKAFHVTHWCKIDKLEV